MKLYILGPSHNGDGAYFLLTETGEGLASHWCSSSGWALGDLEANRPERQAKWHARFGDYQVLYVGEDEMTREKLMALNEELHQQKMAAEAAKTKATTSEVK